MRFPIQFFRTPPRFDFVGKRWLGFFITGFGILATIVSLSTNGLNFGIDFVGGIVMEVRAEGRADIGKMRSLLADESLGDPMLQQVGQGDVVMIRIGAAEGQQQAKVVEQVRNVLTESYGAKLEFLRVDYVGPQVGRELIMGSALAL